MWWIVIVIILVLIVILIITNSSGGSISSTKPGPSLKKVDNKTFEVTIEKYHSSNEVEGPIRSEYVKLYHESEGPVSYIDPSEIDEYRQRFVVFIWNSELGIKERIVGCTVESVVELCEKQFKEWADRVEKEKKIKKNAKMRAFDRESNISKPKNKIPDMIFEVKGLIYRSAKAQLEAVLLEVGDRLLLEEEPDNEVDASAVKVLTISGECIGYVDKEHCVSVGALISLIDRCIVVKKSRHQIPYITAKIEFKE